MIYQCERDKQSLILRGKRYSRQQILNINPEQFELQIEHDVFLFAQDWFADSAFMLVQTSGSTGTPKTIQVKKEQMIQSALATCRFLNLQSGDKALLALPVQYIAGKMMIVRAIVASLNLYPVLPVGNPLAELDQALDFAALIPLQVYNSLQTETESSRLAAIRKVIIGGAAIDQSLEIALRPFPNKFYSTYGMTETLSHIALRRLNGDSASASYYPLESINVSLSPEGTLIIEAPLVCDQTLYTNDLATILPDGSFQITGRLDNVINSGGIKQQIEAIEAKLKTHLPFAFAISSVVDSKLGETVVLLHEGVIDETELRFHLITILDQYELPRHLLRVDHIPYTSTGKIDRKACKMICKARITEY